MSRLEIATTFGPLAFDPFCRAFDRRKSEQHPTAPSLGPAHAGVAASSQAEASSCGRGCVTRGACVVSADCGIEPGLLRGLVRVEIRAGGNEHEESPRGDLGQHLFIYSR